MNLINEIDTAVRRALTEAGAPDAPAIIKQAQRPEFGQYQANGIMGAAKKLGKNPRELASDVVARLDLPLAERVEIAGPGFINIHLSADAVAARLNSARADERLGVPALPPMTYVVDYSAPNLAKELHIGHLRSTTIGDAIVRVLEFMGQNVVRANHVGDWGAQFGSLLAYLDELDADSVNAELRDLEAFYRAASARFRSEEDFARRAREYVVRLQSGDARCLALWERFIQESIRHCQAVYDKLDITLTEADISPESQYNEALPGIIDALGEAGLLTEDDGAQCVFLEEFKGKDGKLLPAIVRKSDGGYPYMATDLAAVRHRVNNLNADVALYIVGAPQALHFQQVFAVARAAGFLSDDKVFRHLPNGNILKSDGKMFKTRDGADVKLADVIDDAIERAYKLVESKNPDLDSDTKAEVARVVGVGALKYAELSKNRTTDYIFDWDTMLSFEGNTAPYLQYAYTRIQSIFKRANVAPDNIPNDITLTDPAEQSLAIKLAQFEEAIHGMLDDYQANVLCNYLYELSGSFMTFYEACPILKAEEDTRLSRLALAAMTANTLKTGLGLLGISTVEQM